MAKKNNKNAMVSVAWAIFISMGIYCTLAVLSIYMFGSSISSNVMDNIDAEVGWESLVLRVAFLIVIACHIPFIFFAGKECFLNMYFELTRRSISKALDKKLSHYNT